MDLGPESPSYTTRKGPARRVARLHFLHIVGWLGLRAAVWIHGSTDGHHALTTVTTPRRDLEVEHPKDHAAGPTAVAVSMKRALGHMGAKRTAQTLLKLNQAEGFDCMSCAWPDPEVGPPARRRVLRERRQGGRRGGHHGPGDPGVLRRAQHRRPGQARPSTGWASRAGSPIRWSSGPGADALRADRLGRGVRADRRPSCNALASPDEAIFYTSGRASNESGLRLPAVRPGVRHQQPARLLEHVPRVDQRRAGRVDRHRQGQRQHRGRLQRQADHRGRPEPRHQPPADAVGAGDRQAATAPRSSRSTRCGRPAWSAFKNPQTPSGRGRQGHQVWPTCTCRSRSTATWRCSRRIGSLLVQWDALDHDFIDRYTTGFRAAGRRTSAPSTGTWSPRPPA